MTRHAALYCRISKDTNGRAEGVATQEKWGRQYAAQAWPDLPVVVYPDNDISASNGDHRPGYEALRDAIRRGDVERLWCVEQSRLERRERHWFELAAELVSAGITELHTNRDGLVRVGDDIAGIKAVLNAGEIRRLTRRINDKLDENAARGLPPGSLPFGYRRGVNDDGDQTYLVVPRQAEAIRWAAERVLAGWSLANVAAGLREQGVAGPHRVKVKDSRGEIVKDGRGQPVTRETQLTASNVRSMLTKPTVAGWRVHRGRVTGRGNWPAILDEDTWQACRARLAGPRTVQRADGSDYQVTPNHAGSPGRKYTLTGGLAVCGVCGAPMVGTLKQLKGGRRPPMPYLICHKKNRRPDGTPAGSCTGIMLEATEQHVADVLFAELDKPEFLDLVAADDHAERRAGITARLEKSDRRRAQLAGLWGAGELTSEEWQAARQAHAESEQRLRAELAAVPAQLARVSIEDARESWEHMTLDERREFLRLFIERVTIRRARPGTKGFDAGRVGVEFITSRRVA